MKTVYLLWWDNEQEYDDHHVELVGVFSSRAMAEGYIAKVVLAKAHRLDGKYEILESELDPTVEVRKT